MANLNSKLHYHLSLAGRTFDLTCTCFEYGKSVHTKAQTWDHPTPAFDRLFLLQKGYATIRQGGREFDIRAEQIHLLPVRSSFNVTYAAGSVLYWFHLINTDSLDLPVFAAYDGVQTLSAGQDLFRHIIDPAGAGRLVEVMPFVFSAVTTFACAPEIESHMAGSKLARYAWLTQMAETLGFQELTVEKLAASRNINRSALSQAFRRHVGMPLKSYLTQVMIGRACDRLTFTEASIQSIAYDLGFPENYYFHRYFKKHVGATPTEYRRNSRRS